MRNNFFYILIVCAFNNSFGNDEEEKSPIKESVKHTREYYEKEAKKDMDKLFSSLWDHQFNEDDTELLNINSLKSRKQMEKIDEVVDEPKTENIEKGNLRTNPQFTAGNFDRGYMQNIPLNFRNTIQSGSNVHNSYADNNQFLQLMNKLNAANNAFLKSRISPGQSVFNHLRNHVNQVNLKPKVYPLLISEGNYGSREFYLNDGEEFSKFINLDTKRKNEQAAIRSTTIPNSENNNMKDFLTYLHNMHRAVAPTRTESNNEVFLNDLMNNFYSKSANNLRPGNRLENFDEIVETMDSSYGDKSKTFTFRGGVVKSDTREPLDEYMKLSEMKKNLTTSPYSFSYSKLTQPLFLREAKQGGFRNRRSTNSQAGYTQDPDTCKTYNENLVKLWSDLSKLLNITEQPNEKALHNIAMMIQAYLEHQNAKQLPETHKTKHEGPRDQISETMLKIRKLLDEGESSAEKITNIIIKYLKPDYAHIQSEDCQKVNEDTLSSAVDLLYKNYLENNRDCNSDDDDDIARSRKVSLRKQTFKTDKTLSNTGHVAPSQAIVDIKPEVQTIFMDDELYKDFHERIMPRQRSTKKNRRVLKRSRKHRSRPAINRSRKSANKKLKKLALKSRMVSDPCKKYAIRKLIVSLRPVMERLMGLLECQHDNTLRSEDFGKVSKNPYYLYASRFHSNEDSRRERKILPKLLATKIGRNINKAPTKIQTNRHDTSVKNNEDGLTRNDETDSAWVRKYSFYKLDGRNSSPVIALEKDALESDMDNNKQQQQSNDYISTYKKYHHYQSPPLYDEYDGIYKTHKVTNMNLFPRLINPLISFNDKKINRSKSTHKNISLSKKEHDTENENSSGYDMYYENNSGESQDISDMEQQTESNLNIETPFIDFTKLRNKNQFVEEKSRIHIKGFDSITEFLKEARDASLRTPEFALPFALDTDKGYVELTHLIKYPKILVYRPQFLVKNTVPYDDFLKIVNNINMTNDEVRLMKIVRHLPDRSVKVLFETEDFEAPLEVRNLNDNLRSGLPGPVANYRKRKDTASENRKDTGRENRKAEFTDSGFPIYRNKANRQFVDIFSKSDSSSRSYYLSPYLVFNPGSDTQKDKEENIYFDLNTETNLTSNNTNSSESSPISGSKSIANSKIPGFDSRSSKDVGFDTSLDLGSKLSPMHLLSSSHANSQFISNPNLSSESYIDSYSDTSSSSPSSSGSYSQLNSHAGSLPTNSNSHLLLPYTDNINVEVKNSFPSSTQSIVIGWWKKWKNIITEKMKKIIRKLASLTDSINQTVTV